MAKMNLERLFEVIAELTDYARNSTLDGDPLPNYVVEADEWFLRARDLVAQGKQLEVVSELAGVSIAAPVNLVGDQPVGELRWAGGVAGSILEFVKSDPSKVLPVGTQLYLGAPKHADAAPVRLVIVSDEDKEYDFPVVVPVNLSMLEATNLVDAAILKVQKDKPDDFASDDLLEELEKHGIVRPEYSRSTVNF